MADRAVRVTRPFAADVREWHALTMKALNEAGVDVGEDFVVMPAKPGLKAKRVNADVEMAQARKLTPDRVAEGEEYAAMTDDETLF